MAKLNDLDPIARLGDDENQEEEEEEREADPDPPEDLFNTVLAKGARFISTSNAVSFPHEPDPRCARWF